ncbi:MAG: nucleotidyltransferase domain-containing protein [Lachnospiraceae bacterium]|nr:nucleotidyltransferase domain-containing protein [Lachnospiraceae bacterium]
MTSAAQLKAQAKYDKTHTRSVLLKLNLTTDADILLRLDEVNNRQGYIKSLIRKDVRGAEEIPSIDAIRTLLLPVVKRYGIKKVYLFGSYARGEADSSSDVDLLIEGDESKGMMTFLELQELMEDCIGKKVDLVESEAMLSDNSRAGRRFRSHIERDKVLLYG